ncbi:AcrR family transcriptional regulator [Rhodopseudomonas julia]|uniref:AcrR family transcriptional regulator n=2 Tax=Rhodopseudomonas julia TaxID=200617 RepID=A0ABU0C1U3_9BRAD|nr:AcrR family transcriptional regulator [Rhodopseudomonas julia]
MYRTDKIVLFTQDRAARDGGFSPAGVGVPAASGERSGTMTRRSFRRATQDERRHALIQATLDLIAEKGLKGITVREVAARAGVTNGLIRHYFSGKTQLIEAAYQSVMEGMTEAAKAAVADTEGDAKSRLRHFIAANLTPPVADPRALSLWATFISLIHVDPAMAAIHRAGYLQFRRELEDLIASLFAEIGRDAEAAERVRLAIQINALIDGLWVERCLAEDMFAEDELVAAGIEAVEALLGLSLARS